MVPHPPSTFLSYLFFSFPFSLTVDCPDPKCSGQGFCVEGQCICKKGWRGETCAQIDDEARQCLPDCSGHGRFDLEERRCECHAGWTGQDCAKRTCGLDCSGHGRCEDRYEKHF